MKKHQAFFIDDHIDTDGVLVSEYKTQPHEGILYRNMTQPTRDLILARNAEMRKDPSVIRDLTFGRHYLRIPVLDFEMLKKKYPILAKGSNDEIKKFYHWFIRQSESEIYRVR